MRYIFCFLLLTFSCFSFAERISLNNAPISDLIDWYYKRSGEAILTPSDVNAKITVYSDNVSGVEIKQFFISVLRANGFDLKSGNPSIIVKYNPSDDDYSEDYASSLDSNSFFESNPSLETYTFPIRNVVASDLVRPVELFLKSNSGGSVFAMDSSNTLVVSSNKNLRSTLGNFITTIDIPVNQLLVEGIIFEVQQSDALDFSFAAGKTKSQIAGGVNTDRLSSALSAAGGSFGIFSGDVLALTVRAIKTNGTSKILSVPRIVTLSGKKGKISIGQNVPFITGRATGDGVNISNPFQTIERKNVGIALDVVPTSLSDGKIILSISSTADSLSSSTAASDVITNQRSISTTVSLNDGNTILLGGLSDFKQMSDKSSVPWLSSIPLIGRLFESTSDSDSKSTLYIMVKASIIKAF